MMANPAPADAPSTLLCFSSLVRPSSRHAFESLRQNVLPQIRGRLDIIGHSPPGNEGLVEALRPLCRHLVWKFEADPVLRDADLAMDVRSERYVNVLRNNLLQWHSLQQCGLLKRDFEAAYGRADRVIWTRPDLVFLWPADIPDTVEPGSVYTSPHDMWGGVNDRFCIADPETMAVRMAVLSFFRDEWYPSLAADPDGVLGGATTTWNPEFVLGCLLRARGLAIRPSYTLFCRLRDIDGRLYGMTPHRDGRATAFGSLAAADAPGDRHAVFEQRFARLLRAQQGAGALVDPRLPQPRLGVMQRLTRLLSGTAPARRLVPLQRLHACERRQR